MDFVEDSSKEFEKSNISGFGNVHEFSQSFFYAQRGRDSSYFGLFSALRDVWLCFFFSQGVVWQKFWAVGMLPCFGPMKRLDFGTDFRLGKMGNLD